MICSNTHPIKVCSDVNRYMSSGFLYLADWKLESITRMNLTSGHVTVLVQGVSLLRSLRVYSKALQDTPGLFYCFFSSKVVVEVVSIKKNSAREVPYIFLFLFVLLFDMKVGRIIN